jgi:hypothetical protein
MGIKRNARELLRIFLTAGSKVIMDGTQPTDRSIRSQLTFTWDDDSQWRLKIVLTIAR